MTEVRTPTGGMTLFCEEARRGKRQLARPHSKNWRYIRIVVEGGEVG